MRTVRRMPDRLPNRPAGGRLTALMLAAALAATLVAGYLAYRSAFARLDASLDQTLIVTRRSIESEIERFRYLPRVLGEDARIRALILSPRDPDAIAQANTYLDRVAQQSGAAQLYVIDETGMTHAASNYREPGSFVGNNYGFRPYFTDAIERGEGRYYAIGVTTRRPGYFLSSRVIVTGADGRDVTGVVVAKVELEPLEEAWRSAGAHSAIADANGVVILSGNPSWKYRPLWPLDAAALMWAAAERTYEGFDMRAASPLVPDGASDPDRAFLASGDGTRLFARFRRIEPDGWRIVAAADPAAATSLAWFWAVVTGLLGLLATGGVRYLEQRRTLVSLRLRQTEILEGMVAERTRELARENEIRRRAEADLRAAQEGLIHSEKMAALGRMSSAIVHEVSQPLAALETTRATAEAVAGNEGAGGVRERVVAARALIKRMQRTVKHLKGFGRKDTGARTLVDVDEAVRNALDVVRPRARDAGIEPEFRPTGDSPKILVVAVKIEQVLINLLINAIDAVEGREGAAITVERDSDGDTVRIGVRDNGPGIAAEHRPRIAEPFFTTKLSGEGLGLGLSISNAILADYGGRLDFEDAEGGGTLAVVTLPGAAEQLERAAAE